jgi:hypothetical protein
MKGAWNGERECRPATLEQGKWFLCGERADNKKGGGPEDPPPQFVFDIRP